mmetsp:Transcript_1044/g.1421  ORF Transcript_1044/g.1421 Transcript_1044/m.1421 type:complete len:117 (+) Transcript_1044:1456-1806(+)
MEKFGQDIVLGGGGSSSSGMASNNLAAELVSITINNLSFSSNGSLEPVTRRLPKSLTVAKLQLMIKQMFGLDPRLQQLSIRVYKDAMPALMDDPQCSLHYFGAIDGAEIFINEAKA